MRRGLAALSACVLWSAMGAAPASADHHFMLIREALPGGISNTSFVELQMYEAGQNLVGSHRVEIYGPSGDLTYTYVFPEHVPMGQNQRTVLLGDTAAGGNPDFVDSGLNIPAIGGAACFVSDTYPDGTPLDCVSWGNFTGEIPGLETGNPASPAGVTAGKSLERRIDRGCSTLLDFPQDTTLDSASDFVEATPSPRNNSVAPTETLCPETRIPTTPVNPNNGTTATFTFDSPGNTNPVPPGLSFACKLDDEPAFTSCSSAKTYPGPLGEGSHTFSVRAILNGVEDPTPATYTWTIDRSPPDTTITELTKPPSPTASQTANFGFTSTEQNSTFRCKLDSAAEEACNLGSKSYAGLGSGSHTFTVYAVDRAGNKDDQAPASYTWTVDRTPPDTTIDSGPTQPVSAVSTAAFTYHAEDGATFKCKLDSGPETDCNDPSGASYSGLTEGQHTFRVYAVDALGNSEGLAGAASYAWTVDAVQAPPPETTITKAPKPRGKDTTPTISFQADSGPATFQCRVDSNAYAPCTSPHTTKKLKIGKHTFDVFATGAGGSEPEPARVSFKIIKK